MTETPIYCAFFTRGTLYEGEVGRLVNSLRAWDLEFHVEPIADRGSWATNTRYTAEFMCDMATRYASRPVVYLDADAVVRKRPVLFDNLSSACDVAVHYVRGTQLANGTVFIAPTIGARTTIERYRTLIEENPDCTDEQIMLARAVNEIQPRVYRLPASYCFIHDISPERSQLGEAEIVIEHLQASRERAGPHCEAWQRRRKRVAEIERTL